MDGTAALCTHRSPCIEASRFNAVRLITRGVSLDAVICNGSPCGCRLAAMAARIDRSTTHIMNISASQLPDIRISCHPDTYTADHQRFLASNPRIDPAVWYVCIQQQQDTVSNSSGKTRQDLTVSTRLDSNAMLQFPIARPVIPPSRQPNYQQCPHFFDIHAMVTVARQALTRTNATGISPVQPSPSISIGTTGRTKTGPAKLRWGPSAPTCNPSPD